jgi:hypothetical protein
MENMDNAYTYFHHKIVLRALFVHPWIIYDYFRKYEVLVFLNVHE